MEEFKIPADIQDELARLRKREKFLSWAVAGFLLVGVFFGFKLFFANPASAQYDSYSSYQAVPIGAGTAGGGGGGCCGAGGLSGPRLSDAELQAKALDLYKQETGRTGVKAQVSDRGCHIQIDILDSKGAIVKSYGYRGGNEVYPIV